ncbi:ATP-binding protein [Streptomyces sp. NPDC002306]
MTRSTAGHLEMDYVVTPLSVRITRTIVRAHLRLWHLQAFTDKAELAVSELLTNVWLHAKPGNDGQKSAQVTLSRIPDGVTLLVHDQDPTLPRLAQASDAEESGRGFQLVTTIADRFGVAPSPNGGKDVWVSFLTPADVPVIHRRTDVPPSSTSVDSRAEIPGSPS